MIKQNLQTGTVIDRADKSDAAMIYSPGVFSEQDIYLRPQQQLKFNPERPPLAVFFFFTMSSGSQLLDHLKSSCK